MVCAALPTKSTYNPTLIFVSVSAVWLIAAVATVWQLVGVWRSGNRLIKARALVGKKAPWAGLAAAAVIIGFLRLLMSFGEQGAPQIAETFRMAFMDDPDIPSYSIRVMRNGTEAKITGGFKLGLTDDFVRVLRASPRIGVIHLNSLGGRIGEAERLNALIRERKLVTFVSQQCVSACTLAFAGGRERGLGASGSLGFNAPTFPGMSSADLVQASRSQRDFFIQAGFDPQLVSKAFATPNEQVWRPTKDELVRARVVTAVSDGSQFAASGLPPGISQSDMARRLRQYLPVLGAIEERLPSEFNSLMDGYFQGYQEGKTEAQLIVTFRAGITPLYAKYRPLADDATLVDLGKLMVQQYTALAAKDAKACYQYASGTGVDRNFALDLPAELAQRELALGERIIRTAAKRPELKAESVAALWSKVGAQMLKSIGPEKLKLATEQNVPPARYADYCEIARSMYTETTRLDPHDAATLIRQLSAEK